MACVWLWGRVVGAVVRGGTTKEAAYVVDVSGMRARWRRLRLKFVRRVWLGLASRASVTPGAELPVLRKLQPRKTIPAPSKPR